VPISARALASLLAFALAAAPMAARTHTVPPEICPAPATLQADDLPVRDVRVTLYNGSRMTQPEIDLLLDVTNRIWAPYGVRLQLAAGPGTVTIALSDRRSAAANASGPRVLGTTLFTGGHATPYINLSRAAAEDFAEGTSQDGVRFSTLPVTKRNAILSRMLGVALAHEIGHYLLDTAHHSSVGLLQEGLGIRELASQDPALLTLTPDQERLLCRALTLHDGGTPAVQKDDGL